MSLRIAFNVHVSLLPQFGSQRAPSLKTKQPPHGFARRLPLELYRGDVDFSTTLPVTVLSILYHPWCRFHHLNRGTHLLDLGSLLSELGCESLYLFLLLRDCCFQLLTLASFGQVGAGRHGGSATTARCAALRCLHRRLNTRLVRNKNIPAKVVVRKI